MRFEECIRKVDTPEFKHLLAAAGFRHLTIQYGSGVHKPTIHTFPTESGDIEVHAFDFDKSLSKYMTESQLVITAGGKICVVALAVLP